MEHRSQPQSSLAVMVGLQLHQEAGSSKLAQRVRVGSDHNSEMLHGPILVSGVLVWKLSFDLLKFGCVSGTQ